MPAATGTRPTRPSTARSTTRPATRCSAQILHRLDDALERSSESPFGRDDFGLDSFPPHRDLADARSPPPDPDAAVAAINKVLDLVEADVRTIISRPRRVAHRVRGRAPGIGDRGGSAVVHQRHGHQAHRAQADTTMNSVSAGICVENATSGTGARWPDASRATPASRQWSARRRWLRPTTLRRPQREWPPRYPPPAGAAEHVGRLRQRALRLPEQQRLPLPRTAPAASVARSAQPARRPASWRSPRQGRT